MTKRTFLGEFEQMLMLAILQQEDHAFGLDVRREIERSTGKAVSRGAFYTTVDRLERKGYLTWSEALPDDARGGAPQRRFEITEAGLMALRVSRRALMALSRGLDGILEDS